MTRDKWTVGLSVIALGGALLACKKDEAPEPAVTVAPAPAPEPPKVEEPKAEEKKDEVKRYDDEKEEKGTVKVGIFEMKIYQEADTSSTVLAKVGKGTLVNRKARRGSFLLIEYPSAPGELSPGWAETRHINDQIVKVDPDAVKKQDAGTTVKVEKPPEEKPPEEKPPEEKPPEEKPPEEKPPEEKPPEEKPPVRRMRLPKRGIPAPPGGRPAPK